MSSHTFPRLTGHSAFPLTPLLNDRLDEPSFQSLVQNLAIARPDSIGVLGSTGSGMYLSDSDRRRAVEIALEHSSGIPTIVGTSALATAEVLRSTQEAAELGAAAVMIAPVSYLPLGEREVFGLFQRITAETDVPVVVYDNPTTTRFSFSTELHIRIAQLPHIAAIKLPGAPFLEGSGAELVRVLRSEIPATVSIGVSGDPAGTAGLEAGCDVWFSSLGGTLPQTINNIVVAAKAGAYDRATALSGQLAPLWQLFQKHGGGIRVIATIAQLMGLAGAQPLPHPIQGLEESDREEVATVLSTLLLEERR